MCIRDRGEDLPLSRDVFYSMDYISHGGTLLDPESWYFHQYGAFNEDDSPNDVPHLEVIITRYPLDILAEMRAEEWSRQKFNNSGDYQQFDVLDECLYSKREGRTHVNEITGEPRVFLPGGILVLRRGDTVLFADYYGCLLYTSIAAFAAIGLCFFDQVLILKFA